MINRINRNALKQKKTPLLKGLRLIAPYLLHQHATLTLKHAGAKSTPGRSSGSCSAYFLHLPEYKVSGFYADFVTLTAVGPRLNFTTFPFHFQTKNLSNIKLATLQVIFDRIQDEIKSFSLLNLFFSKRKVRFQNIKYYWIAY